MRAGLHFKHSEKTPTYLLLDAVVTALDRDGSNDWPQHPLIIFESQDPVFRIVLRANPISFPSEHLIPAYDVELPIPIPDPIPNARGLLLSSGGGTYCKEILWATELWLCNTKSSDWFLSDLFKSCFDTELLPVKAVRPFCDESRRDILNVFGLLSNWRERRRASERTNLGPTVAESQGDDRYVNVGINIGTLQPFRIEPYRI
jgi:hypothetical protein